MDKAQGLDLYLNFVILVSMAKLFIFIPFH
jgi:hypothetical protein